MTAQSKIVADEPCNTRLWDALGKTDPAHTKAFKRAGGFSGTAIKPIWITQRLTEKFGPCGTGWGMGKPEFQTVFAADGEVLVYCTVEGWYNENDKVAVVYGVGGDKCVTNRQSGPFCDDEAFKKAFTDAIGNAFKFIGVAADVHMGLFEDSKYLAEVAAEFNKPRADPVPVEPITDAQRDLILTLAPATGKTVQGICEAYKVANLGNLTKGQGEAILKRLQPSKEAEPAK